MTGISPSRAALLSHIRALLEQRRDGYAREIESLDEAASGETKSSAGDKYETAREMIAQSRRLMDGNLLESKSGLDALERMAAGPAGEKAGFGSLVETSQGWYLLGISVGEVEFVDAIVRTASLVSPIGIALKGKCPGESVAWRGGTIEIFSFAA